MSGKKKKSLQKYSMNVISEKLCAYMIESSHLTFVVDVKECMYLKIENFTENRA